VAWLDRALSCKAFQWEMACIAVSRTRQVPKARRDRGTLRSRATAQPLTPEERYREWGGEGLRQHTPESSAHAHQGKGDKGAGLPALPAYPPAVCVTTNWKPESCEDRAQNLPAYPPVKEDTEDTGPNRADVMFRDLRDMLEQRREAGWILTEQVPLPRPRPVFHVVPITYGAEQVNILGPPPPYVIRKDFGGVIGPYLLKYKALEWTPIIIDGECNSACTLVLANKHVCATDRGFFYFHGAKDTITGVPRAEGTAELWKRYPSQVRDWITAHGGLTTKWIGAKATVFLPLCKEGI
jgi:hypothetical protein